MKLTVIIVIYTVAFSIYLCYNSMVILRMVIAVMLHLCAAASKQCLFVAFFIFFGGLHG